MSKKQFAEKLKSYNAVSTFFMMLVLQLVEELLEMEFQCPPDSTLALLYTLSFLLLPGFIWCALAWIFLSSSHRVCPAGGCKGCKGCKGCGHCLYYSGLALQTVYPFGLWIVVLTIDGRYFECMSTFWKAEAASAGPTLVTKGPSQILTIGQMVGMSTLFLILLVSLVWKCCTSEGALGDRIRRACSCCSSEGGCCSHCKEAYEVVKELHGAAEHKERLLQETEEEVQERFKQARKVAINCLLLDTAVPVAATPQDGVNPATAAPKPLFKDSNWRKESEGISRTKKLVDNILKEIEREADQQGATRDSGDNLEMNTLRNTQ